MARSTSHRIRLFGFAGAVGFCVNLSGLILLKSVWGPVMAQLVAFGLATACTWELNRRQAFRDRTSPNGHHKSALRYVCASVLNAAMINGLYVCFLAVPVDPVIALILAGAVAMMSNYVVLDRWVFKKEAQEVFP